MNTMNLIDFKNLKKLKIVANDLEKARQLLIASIELLKDYRKYVPVMESISTLHNSRTIIEIHLNHYKRLVEKYNTETSK
jgi:hypothetical protein